MKVAESRYIAGARDAMDALERALAAEFPYASVLLQDTFGRRYSVSAGGINVALSAMNTGRGGVVRVHDGRGYGEYSFSALGMDEVPAIMNGVRAMLPLTGSTYPGSGSPPVSGSMARTPFIIAGTSSMPRALSRGRSTW